jgi:hypothetical protein
VGRIAKGGDLLCGQQPALFQLFEELFDGMEHHALQIMHTAARGILARIATPCSRFRMPHSEIVYFVLRGLSAPASSSSVSGRL